ncbi:MAG: rhomboid family intramembrane serine protease [Armatimonadetes bacterium]|nr:rhomboid family intramembrane serine protease [Armatimonadota bacterium]MDE2207151.1 rhomboid family intramembrane serine protease [Armatimonadota bacterium]
MTTNSVRQARSQWPPVTTGLLVIIGLIFVAMMNVGHQRPDVVGMAFGDQEPAMVRAGQWWRLITPIFLHASVPHVALNGLSLWMLGSFMERTYGSRRFFLIFVVTGICGSLLSQFFLHNASLGASGAIFGLVGAGMAFPIRFKRLVNPEAGRSIFRQLLFITVINLGYGLMESQTIDNYAHIGGLISGLAMGCLLIPEVLDRRRDSRRAAALAATCGALGLLILVSGGLQALWTHRMLAEGGSWAYKLEEYGSQSAQRAWQCQLPVTWKTVEGASNGLGIATGPNGLQLSVTYTPDLPRTVVTATAAANGYRVSPYSSRDRTVWVLPRATTATQSALLWSSQAGLLQMSLTGPKAKRTLFEVLIAFTVPAQGTGR